MGSTCKYCGCKLACPICEDASQGLVDTIDQLQQQRDVLRDALQYLYDNADICHGVYEKESDAAFKRAEHVLSKCGAGRNDD